MGLTIKRCLTIAVVVFALLTGWFGLSTRAAMRDDAVQNAAIDRAAALARARLPQAREVFEEYRQYIEILAASEEMYARRVTIFRDILISLSDEDMWRMHQWSGITWLPREELRAAVTLMEADIMGARDVSIIFTGDTMNFTVFGTPIHEHPPRAWVAFLNGDDFAWQDRPLIHSEPIGDGWQLTITTNEPQDRATTVLVITIIFAVLTLAALAVLIWGIRTFRFLSGGDNTDRSILIIVIVGILIVIVGSYFIIRSLG